MPDHPAAWLSVEEYERWLLPPEPLTRAEKIVQSLSLGAGIAASAGGLGFLWWLL